MERMTRDFSQMLGGGWRLAALALALLITLAIGSTVVSAQSDPDAAVFSSPLAGPGEPRGERNAEGDPLDGIVDRDQIMADALGITVEELEAEQEAGTRLEELIDRLGLDHEAVHEAVQKATEAAVEQSIADGLITEEEAQAGHNPPSGRRPGNMAGGPLDDIVEHDQILADALGISVEELEAGTRLEELIEELGLDPETVRQAVQDATEAAVEQAIADGLITEEEAQVNLTPPSRSSDEGRPGPGGPGGPIMRADEGDAGSESIPTDDEATDQPGRPGSGGPPGGPIPPADNGDTDAEASSADAEAREQPDRLGPGGFGGGPRGGGR